MIADKRVSLSEMSNRWKEVENKIGTMNTNLTTLDTSINNWTKKINTPQNTASLQNAKMSTNYDLKITKRVYWGDTYSFRRACWRDDMKLWYGIQDAAPNNIVAIIESGSSETASESTTSGTLISTFGWNPTDEYVYAIGASPIGTYIYRYTKDPANQYHLTLYDTTTMSNVSDITKGPYGLAFDTDNNKIYTADVLAPTGRNYGTVSRTLLKLWEIDLDNGLYVDSGYTIGYWGAHNSSEIFWNNGYIYVFDCDSGSDRKPKMWAFDFKNSSSAAFRPMDFSPFLEDSGGVYIYGYVDFVIYDRLTNSFAGLPSIESNNFGYYSYTWQTPATTESFDIDDSSYLGSMPYSTTTVTNVATKLFTSDKRRVGFEFCNNGANVIYLGSNSSLTTSNGFPLDPYAKKFYRYSGDLWIVASANTELRYREVFSNVL